ncbi:MAG: multicopper oxidase domain-containing protein [Ilumatobacter sp.]
MHQGHCEHIAFQVDRRNNPGEWMIRCHNAYHPEAGMATVLPRST